MAAMDTTAGGMSGTSSDSASKMGIDTSRTETKRGAAPAGKPNRSTGEGAASNQTKSGVTNTKTGKSTLGPGATQTRPDQGQPVTSKGDTVSSAPDSGATNR
jgi:hypothetical protein